MVKPRRANGFYDTPEWKALRRLALIRDGYCCTICRCDVRGKGKARVDHIHSIQARPDLALVLSNVRTLCTLHDAQAHREKGGAPNASRQGKRDVRFVIKGADASGMPLDPGHHWQSGFTVKPGPTIDSEPHPTYLGRSAIPLHIVCGAPGSGKSTLVRALAHPDDLVIDLDDIASEISGEPQHAWSRRWLPRALHRRNELLASLSRAPSWPAAWFIVSEPNGPWRQWWVDRLRPVDVTLVMADKAECMRRVNDRRFYQRQQALAVCSWFDRYTPRIGDVVVTTTTTQQVQTQVSSLSTTSPP